MLYITSQARRTDYRHIPLTIPRLSLGRNNAVMPLALLLPKVASIPIECYRYISLLLYNGTPTFAQHIAHGRRTTEAIVSYRECASATTPFEITAPSATFQVFRSAAPCACLASRRRAAVDAYFPRYIAHASWPALFPFYLVPARNRGRHRRHRQQNAELFMQHLGRYFIRLKRWASLLETIFIALFRGADADVGFHFIVARETPNAEAPKA